MACAELEMSVRSADEEDGYEDSTELQEPPMPTRYEATTMIPGKKEPLHDLMKKQPCVVGSLQMASGLFSVGLGIVFALSQKIEDSLFTLFRVCQLTGVMFMFAGAVSILLSKHPRLLPMSLRLNCGCIIVTLVAVCLTIIDLALGHEGNLAWENLKWVKVMSLCVMVLEVFLSALLCIWFSKKKCA